MDFLCPFLQTQLLCSHLQEEHVKEDNKMTTNPVLNTNPAGYSAEIAELIRSNLTPKRMQEKLSSYHENDIASTLELLSKSEREKLYQILDSETLADILEYSDHMGEYVQELTLRKKVDVFSRMETADVVDVLRQLERKERETLIDLLNPEVRSEVKLLSSFDEDEIGSVMSTNYIVVSDHASVKEAMSELVRQAADNDNISTIYVVDQNETFYGAIDLKDLIIAREGTDLTGIMTCSYPYIYARASIEDCIPQLMDYSEDSVPVLDNENKLIGVITASDLVEVVGDELNEDYAKLAGLSAEEDLEEPIRLSVKKRLPWLFVLLAMGLGVSATVGLFESIVAQLPVIMCFQSLILDMAGNVGTQSLAVAIRVLMDKQITGKQKAALILKESRVGLSNGLILGILSFIVIGAYLVIKGNAVSFAFAVSGCLGAAMVLAMLISSLSGTIIPIFFQKVGVDPAVASGPLITTVNDLVAVISYYGLAWLILLEIMHLG